MQPMYGAAELLVGVDERAGALDARRRVHDLVAVDLAAPALDLVLRPQRQSRGCVCELLSRVDCGSGDRRLRKT